MAEVRVYELAKEFGVESKVVMAKLQELGEFVRSASSTIEAPVVRKLTDALQQGSGGGKPAPARKAARRSRVPPLRRRLPSGRPAPASRPGRGRAPAAAPVTPAAPAAPVTPAAAGPRPTPGPKPAPKPAPAAPAPVAAEFTAPPSAPAAAAGPRPGAPRPSGQAPRPGGARPAGGPGQGGQGRGDRPERGDRQGAPRPGGRGTASRRSSGRPASGQQPVHLWWLHRMARPEAPLSGRCPASRLVTVPAALRVRRARVRTALPSPGRSRRRSAPAGRSGRAPVRLRAACLVRRVALRVPAVAPPVTVPTPA